MIDNDNQAAAEWRRDYEVTYNRLRNEGQPHLTATIMASNEVTARRGAEPSLAKAHQDQGGPLGGQQ